MLVFAGEYHFESSHTIKAQSGSTKAKTLHYCKPISGL
jgi:hypothetical protein